MRKIHKQATSSVAQEQQSAAALHDTSFHLQLDHTTTPSTDIAADAAMSISGDSRQRKSPFLLQNLSVTFAQGPFPIPAWLALLDPFRVDRMTSGHTSQLLSLRRPTPNPTLSKPIFIRKVAVPQLLIPFLPSIARSTDRPCLVPTLRSLGIPSKLSAILNSPKSHTRRPSTRNKQTNSLPSCDRFRRVRPKSRYNLIMKSPRPGSVQPR